MKAPDQPLTCVLKAYEQVPDLYLILSPDLVILTASDAYLKATYTKREEIVGRCLFDVFPDNPMAKAANGVENLNNSLQQVLATRRPRSMAMQHYDVPLPAALGGGFAEKYWLPLNTPVLDEQGQVQYIIHRVEDITEQQKLLQSKNLLQDIIDAPNIGIAVYKAVRNKKGDIVDFVHEYINRASVTMLNGQDFTGKLFTEHGENALLQMKQFAEVIETGKDNNYIREADFGGSKVWFAITNTPLPGDRLVHTWEDVTERKKAEEALKQSKELIQTVFDVTLNPIAYHKAVRDVSGKIIDFEFQLENRVARRYAADDRRGKRYSEAYPGIKDTIVFKKYSEVVETGEKLDTEVQINLKGNDYWFHLMGVKLGDGLVATAVDITERKNAEQEILLLKDEIAQKATDKYQALFYTMEEGLSVIEMIYDTNGKPVDLRLLEVNPAYERITGLKNVAGKLGSEIVPSEQYWLDAYDSVIKTGKALRYENYHAGARQWYRTHTSRIGGPGSHVVANLFEDITERKQRELHQQFLIRFSDALRAAPDADAVANSALKMLAEHLELDRCYVGVALLEKDLGIFPYQFGNDRVPPMPEAGVSLSDFPDALRTTFDETLVITDFQNTEGLTETEKQNFAAIGFGALVVANVRKELRKPDWSINAVSATPRRWTQLEIQLIEEVTERTWAAVERAKAEEALRQSEEKYRTLFDSIDEGYCIIQMIYDEEGNAVDFLYLQVNQAFERNNGLHNAEGRTIRELAPDIEPKWMEIYGHVAKTGNSLRFEESSEALHRVFSLYAFRIGNPADHKVAVIFTDITNHKKAQEALRESEEQFRLFVTASSDIIYKMNADWSRMQMLTGKEFLPGTEEPASTWAAIYMAAEDKELVNDAIQEAIRTKSIFRLEHRVNKADGTVGWVSSRAVPVVNKDGSIKEWFGTASDITLRKEAEQQLHELNERLEQLVADRTRELNESKLFAEQVTEATPDFVMIFNLLTNKVEFVNQGPYSQNQERYHETLRIGYDELMSRAHPDDRPKLNSFIDGFRTASDQITQTLEYRVLNQDKVTWYRSRGKVFRRDEAGKPTHFISVVQDIGDLKQLEQENIQMRLDQQRNLLLAILEAQEEERRRISESLHNGVAQLLYAAKLQVEGLVQKVPNAPALKINELLKDAINETRRVSHELVPVILKDFGLKQALCEMCERLSSRNLRIACEVETFEQKPDNYIELVLYRTCQELVNNILKHAKASEAKILLYQEDSAIHLKVRDNGMGIKRLATGRKGIGLRSIKNRIKLLNGTFEITVPATGKGTQVEIVIPL